MTMTQVEVQYFAVLRERAGLQRESLSTAAATAAELYDELADRHAFGLPRSMLRVAINDEFADWSRRLQPGDRVVFIPPVAGG
jgi:molybdopterin converting factor subunit 1